MDIKICSWNLQNCTIKSFNKINNKKYGKKAELEFIIKNHDLIALQEVRDTECIEYFAKLTGYNYWVSEPICSTESCAHQTGKRRERYAFLWNSNIKCIKQPVILNGNTAFVRPPAIAFFGVVKDNLLFDFVIANIHLVWGTKRDREIELQKTNLLFSELNKVLRGEDNIIICGDFNNKISGIIKSPTLISGNSYDNFILSEKTIAKSCGVINTTTISDHYPIYMEIFCNGDCDNLEITNQISDLVLS